MLPIIAITTQQISLLTNLPMNQSTYQLANQPIHSKYYNFTEMQLTYHM